MKLHIKRTIFNDTFYPLLDDEEHDIILLVGGGASGKSYFSFQRAVIRALKDKRKYLVIRKSAVDLRRSCWEDLMNTLKQFQIYDKVKANKTNMTVELPNGSSFILMGLDDYEKIKSIPGITDALIEEASEITFDDYSQIKMRLRGNGVLRNQVVLMTNPISKLNWIYKFFFEEGCKETNCLIHQSTYKDNRFVNAATIQALEGYKETNPMFYKVYCLGEFGSISKLVYYNWKEQNLDTQELLTSGYELCVGLDWGYTADPTAIIEMLADTENKKLYVINEFYKTGVLNEQIASVITSMGLSKSTIICDSAEPKSIDELKKAGIRKVKPSLKGAGSINSGIDKIKTFEIIVDSSCINTINELQNYSYKKDKSTGEYTNEPVDKFNHLMDAMRYGIQCLDSKHQLRTLPKYSL